MHSNVINEQTLDARTRKFYTDVLSKLAEFKIPFLAGGAYALGLYTGIIRDTKDFDIFVHPRDVKNLVQKFADAGLKTELTDSVWLAKIFLDDSFVDVIFGFRNSVAQVDDEWFAYARTGKLLGFDIKISPPEEMLWSKCFIMTRERFDGADIAHIILGQSGSLDWTRLLRRFGAHWRLLYVNLIMFGYIYPGQRHLVPHDVIQELEGCFHSEEESPPPSESVCQGSMLSATDFVPDIKEWGFRAK